MPPAFALLQPDCSVKPSWAVFDPVWYLKTYGNELPSGMQPEPGALLAYYLRTGCLAGHSPNPLFDETWYLSVNRQIAALVKAGRYASGFDHYCQLGHRFHSGHWLFDDTLYGNLFADMSLDNLDANGLYGRYDHYLRAGQHEQRMAHLLFDGAFYAARAIAAGEDARIVQQIGPFTHFLNRLETAAVELPPSFYFDPVWYAERHKQFRAGPAIAHYLRHNGPDHLDPVPEFSEAFYRLENPDVKAAINSGGFDSGYQHFLQIGVFEFRQPSLGIDLTYYRDANSAVRRDLNSGASRDAFAHLRAFGIPAGLPCAPLAPTTIGEAAAKQLFLLKARCNLAVMDRRKLDFTCTAASRLSVIIVLFEMFELTMLALSSLRQNYAGELQLILVDNGSADETVNLAQYVTGARIIRLAKNIGYLKACNLALREVSCEWVLYLNNDIELGHGAVDAAIARLENAADIGAVGGKIIRTHGMLQEAGCIIWQDGSTSGYMRDASPLAPEVNFVRDVDFCSGVFLLCRSAVLQALGGLDLDFSPAYYEDADLCVRMMQAGFRIVYDPAITVHHLEYGSADSQSAQAQMQRGQKIFQRKHEIFLQTQAMRNATGFDAARSARKLQKKILFIEDIVPLRGLGSGYVRANDIVRAMSAAGHAVSVFPVNGSVAHLTRMYSEFPDNVEILHDRHIGRLTEFLDRRRGDFDLIWVSRTHNLDRILPYCLAAGADPGNIPFVLDTEAIATMRDFHRAALNGVKTFEFASRLRSELQNAVLCRQCVAVNAAEAALLRRSGLENVAVLGTMRVQDATEKSYAARQGLLYVASIHQPDSPNLDALFWYAEAILPALALLMPEPPVLNVAGYVAAGIDLSPFANHPHIKIHGPAFSLREHYDNNRLFIAPTRFAAGTAYKLYEAAAFGLPIVATSLLASQLDWQDGTELLTAPADDANRFAAQIARLYRSPETWEHLRARALSRLAKENTADAFYENVAGILEAAWDNVKPDAASGAVGQRSARDPVAVG